MGFYIRFIRDRPFDCLGGLVFVLESSVFVCLFFVNRKRGLFFFFFFFFFFHSVKAKIFFCGKTKASFFLVAYLRNV